MLEHEVSFGERLRQFRVRAGLSQAALAERAGIAPAAVAALERGARRSPYPQTLRALSDALRLTPDERALLADVAMAARRASPPASSAAPLSPPETDPPPPNPAPVGVGGRSATSTPSQTGLRVMLVEDEDLFRDLLQSALGHQPRMEIVGAFGDSSAALAGGPPLRPDVAVLDIQLPGSLDGIHLGLELRRALPKLGIVLLSNYTDLRFVAALHRRPITGWSYLLKQSVRNVAALRRAVEGAADGDIMLDPSLVAGLQPRQGGPVAQLTPRQQEVLGLVAQGLTNAAIARELVLAEKSVENLMTGVYETFGIDRRDQTAHARVQAVLRYLQDSRFVSGRGAPPAWP